MIDEQSARDQIVKLLVGTHPSEILHVHEGVLCKSSAFFKRSLKPEWAEKREDPYTIDLSDDHVDDVQNYINWLYSEKVSGTLADIPSNANNTIRHEIAHNAFIPLAKAYVLGEKFLDTKYKNSVMNRIIEVRCQSGWSPGPACAEIIYEGTSPGSPARRLLADLLAYGAHDDSDETVGWMKFIEDLPREALVDAMKALVKLRRASARFDWTDESYLEKDED